MITPTGNQRSPYNYFRQQRNSQISFADLLAKSVAGSATGTAIQRSSLVFGAKDDPADVVPPALPSWMGRVGEMVLTEEEAIRRAWKAAEPTYPKSIFDLSPAEYEKAARDAREAAYYYEPTEGKTKLEIYNDIKAIYESYLGKDFRAPQQLFWTWPAERGSHESNLRNAEFDFQQAVGMHGAKGRYDGMGEDEIRRAIRDQYPKDMTLGDCLMMSEDLFDAGLDKSEIGDSYAREIIRNIRITTGGGNASKMILKAMLDRPGNYDAMKANFLEFERNGRVIELATDMEGVFKQLCSWVGWSGDEGEGILEMLEEMEERGELAFNEAGFLVEVKPGETEEAIEE